MLPEGLLDTLGAVYWTSIGREFSFESRARESEIHLTNSELNTQPACTLFTLRRAPRGAQRKTRGRVVRCAFLVGLFHSLLRAGLARRTDSAILHDLMKTPTVQPCLGCG
jgi:hypothetical protein